MEEEEKDITPLEITNEQKVTKDDSTIIKKSFNILVGGLWKSFRNIMSIREGTDIQGTIDGIKKDIEFKGHSAWILIFSIFIASIGLNINSTAIIIGAMLISPLMGPILGIGLAVATNDLDTLKKSLFNFGVAVGISLVVATVYFFVSPLHEVQSELLTRTKPTFLDALVAIFGGAVGIIAGSRSEKTNVIPGVAIATALMPPLCTAGFGLATGNMVFFFGAMYLFLLNCVFISITTVIVCRYLHFPRIHNVDGITETKVKRYIIAFVFLVIAPSAWIFIDVVKESMFKTRAESFIAENIDFDGTHIVNTKLTYTDTISKIELFALGELLPAQITKNLNSRLASYDLDDTKLIIHQAKDETDKIAGQLTHAVREGIIEEMFTKNKERLEDKDRYIRMLERKIYNYQKDSIPFENLRAEVRIQYPELQRIGFANLVQSELEGVRDTIPTFFVKWQEKTRNTSENEEKLAKWLKVRFDLDTVWVLPF